VLKDAEGRTYEIDEEKLRAFVEHNLIPEPVPARRNPLSQGRKPPGQDGMVRMI